MTKTAMNTRTEFSVFHEDDEHSVRTDVAVSTAAGSHINIAIRTTTIAEELTKECREVNIPAEAAADLLVAITNAYNALHKTGRGPVDPS